MKRKRVISFIIFMLIAALSLTGCGFGSNKETGSQQSEKGNSGSKKQVLNVTASAEIPTMDSTKAHDAVAFTVLNNTNEGLYRQDQNNQPILAMAEQDNVSADGKVHTFTIRDAKWSNGDPVTAHDFEYAWKRVMKEAGPYNYMFVTADVKNAQAIMDEKISADELGVKALDDKTLEVTLENPNPLLETLLTFGTFLPQNQKFVEKMGDKYALEADNLLSNGPFKLAEWKHESSWKYVKNPTYWDAKSVKLDEINVYVVKDDTTGLNLYESKKVDRVGLTAATVDNYRDDKEFKTNTLAGIGFLRFNLNNSILKNKNIRKAINFAIDKKGLTDIALNNGAVPLYGVVPKNYYYSPDKKDYRELNGELLKGTTDDAKKYWNEGLKETGAKSVKLSINISDAESSKQMAEFIQSQLETNLPGFTLEIKAVPFEQRLEIEKAIKYDISLSTWGPDYSDPMTYLDMWVTGGSANREHYSNPKYDALVEKARLETDKAKRYEMLLQLEKMLLEEDVAIAPLYQSGEAILQHNNIKDLIEHPSGADFSYKWTYIE
ncbi:peptide ABC transporter substrate-binding protein [Bacillus sp. FJAT-49736]|uniref:peptide ABC transporter substrate-binding protein n=1 Tax=Bacillus sp. FJAT-49736 TaxID=2833582 RepID=UPI001BCA2119|nr:peptide ABC transporter substrate-binding protein [Bacillus sp. FJAT-49736]MBS4171855.1 peptide ABC transporter substrate-binding protein [Bacillus sp. FJAT-49736]